MCDDDPGPSGLRSGRVSESGAIARDLLRMVLSVEKWADPSPVPGQFLMMRVSERTDPLLSRPFSIAGFERKGKGAAIEVLYREVGVGTAAMARWPLGQEVRFLGPLGRGFDLPPEGSRVIMFAGGIGIPPLLFLAREMAARGRCGELTLLYSEPRHDRFYPLETCFLPGMETCFCTRDGSRGRKGRVTDWLREQGDVSGTCLFSCGPSAMMKDIFIMTSGMELAAQYSMEARMACGFGVCMGCAIPVQAKGEATYVRVCTEGPVFDGRELTEESFVGI